MKHPLKQIQFCGFFLENQCFCRVWYYRDGISRFQPTKAFKAMRFTSLIGPGLWWIFCWVQSGHWNGGGYVLYLVCWLAISSWSYNIISNHIPRLLAELRSNFVRAPVFEIAGHDGGRFQSLPPKHVFLFKNAWFHNYETLPTMRWTVYQLV